MMHTNNKALTSLLRSCFSFCFFSLFFSFFNCFWTVYQQKSINQSINQQYQMNKCNVRGCNCLEKKTWSHLARGWLLLFILPTNFKYQCSPFIPMSVNHPWLWFCQHTHFETSADQGHCRHRRQPQPKAMQQQNRQRFCWMCLVCELKATPQSITWLQQGPRHCVTKG